MGIVRDYLISGIVPAFGTVSDQRWTIDFAELRARDPKLANAWGPNPTPPAGTRNGVTRYEVWRLPSVVDEPGFVNVALVADMDATGDIMEQVDERIDKWLSAQAVANDITIPHSWTDQSVVLSRHNQA